MRRNVPITRGTGTGRGAQGWTAPVNDEFEDHLLKIQQDMDDSDEDENLEDDDSGTVFDKTTNLYEEHKLADGTMADKWATETNSVLQLNWREHPSQLSHYSHGDCGGLGFASTMEKKLGQELSNQAYQPQKPPDFARTDSIPTQDWEVTGVGPVGGFHGVVKPGANLSWTLTADTLY